MTAVVFPCLRITSKFTKGKIVIANREENWESLSIGPAADPGLIQKHDLDRLF